ncbi:hypothetical protein BDV35DRAFT_365379 [Aspergillus flavus]|uniref:Uncharacterized protein n=1 Tax=Aspergillus flavus TaxID=5059 RepID=A0A5N6GNU6_ASPFL|nr:hypothetical protein BDV35DRAFT_365379 [Aspergillus flavus]
MPNKTTAYPSKQIQLSYEFSLNATPATTAYIYLLETVIVICMPIISRFSGERRYCLFVSVEYSSELTL